MTETFSMTRRGALALVGASVLASAARAATGPDWAGLDVLVGKALADGLAPGLSLTATKAGAVVYSKGYGLANIETNTPVTPETVFRIGSITKQFTGAAMMLLQQDGKLSVDDRLAKYLPTVPRAGEITLRQMLNHTAGLGNYTNRKPPEAFLQSARLDYDSKALLADMLAHTDPLYPNEPGTKWDYSNTAYVLLGLVIEKVAGEPWPSLYERRLFKPAGLADTMVDNVATVVPHRASGYTGHAGSSDWDNASYISMTYPGAAGNIRSTTVDLCKWHAALLAGRIVSADSLKAMMTAGRLKDGSIPVAALGPGESKPLNYGFGLSMAEFEGHASVGHSGGIFGFISDVRSFPAEKTTVAVLINADGGGGKNPVVLLKALQGVQDAAARAALAA